MKVVSKNKRAKYDYDIKDTFIAGISLFGGEVKSIKKGDVNIVGSFVKIDNKKNLILYGMNISKYEFETLNNYDPLRNRQLLMHKKEIRKINDKIILERYLLIPLNLKINSRGYIKVELALCKPRKKYDKRQYEKEKTFRKEKQYY